MESVVRERVRLVMQTIKTIENGSVSEQEIKVFLKDGRRATVKISAEAMPSPTSSFRLRLIPGQETLLSLPTYLNRDSICR